MLQFFCVCITINYHVNELPVNPAAPAAGMIGA